MVRSLLGLRKISDLSVTVRSDPGLRKIFNMSVIARSGKVDREHAPDLPVTFQKIVSVLARSP